MFMHEADQFISIEKKFPKSALVLLHGHDINIFLHNPYSTLLPEPFEASVNECENERGREEGREKAERWEKRRNGPFSCTIPHILFHAASTHPQTCQAVRV